MGTLGTAPQRGPIHYNVEITSGNPPTLKVTPPGLVKLSIRNQDTVSWDCDKDFVVCFGKPKGSPFARTHFHRGLPDSGPVPNGTSTGTYDYIVETRDGVLDPGVIIDP